MDFLNKTSTQITELFRSMSPGARIIAGLLLVIVVISLSYLVTHQSNSPDAYLFGARTLTNTEIARATAAFAKANLSNWDGDGNRLRVPRGQKHLYLAALVDNGAMPRAPFDFDQEAALNSSVWMTTAHHAQAVKTAAERELSLIIRHMSGVENAIVKYQTTTENNFLRRDKKVTAGVTVWPEPGLQFDDNHVNSIRHFVANAIGTKPNLVDVFDMESGIMRSSKLNVATSSSPNLYQAVKKELEEYFAAKALKAIELIPDATVVVNIDLDKTINEEIYSNVGDPTKPLTVQSSETTENQSTTNRPVSGEPGLARQSNNTAAAVTNWGKESGSTIVKTVESSTKELSRAYVEKIKAGLTPVSATVAVSFPKSYYRKVWKMQNPPPDGQDAEPPDELTMSQFVEQINNEIKSHIAHVLPDIPDDESKVKPISVVAFEKMATPEPDAPPLTATAGLWLSNNWSTLSMMGIGVFSLIMLRGMIRSLPPASGSSAAPGASAEAPTLGIVRPDDEDENSERALQRSMSGPNLRDELADMVRDDPDAAAKVISSWVGNVA